MTFYRFEDKDKFTNYLKTKPSNNFLIHNSNIVYNYNYKESGSFTDPITFSTEGEKNLYELNIDRPSDEKIYPFVTKNSSRTFLGTISTSKFNSNFQYGDKITGSYPLTSSVRRNHYLQGATRSQVDALRNTFDYYARRSPHYQFSSSFGDKSDQECSLISIPKIFYGDKIDKGSVTLDFYISGALMGRLEDRPERGELVQTKPSGSSNSGSVAGVCLYEEGFLFLTGSWALDSQKRAYIDDTNNKKKPKWVYFGAGIEDSFSSGIIPSSSFEMDFKGNHLVPKKTMMVEAPTGQLNYSENPSYLEKGQSANKNATTSSVKYMEPTDKKIANVVSASYSDMTASFEKTTFINKVALYDDNKRLLGVAKTARPIRKKAGKSFLFKLELDI